MLKGMKVDIRQGLLFCGLILFMIGCGGSGGATGLGEPANDTGDLGNVANAAGSDNGGADSGAPPQASQQTGEARSTPQPTATDQPGGEWSFLGGRLNGGPALSLSMAVPAGVPYVAWEEGGLVHVAFWNGASWQSEGPLNKDRAKPALLPSLFSDGSGLYLSWTEGEGAKTLYLMKKENGRWTDVASQASVSEGGVICWPANADLAVLQGVPILGVDTFCSEGYQAATAVRQWAGSWLTSAPPGMMAHDAGAPAPRKYTVASDDTDFYLAVWEGVKLDETALKVYRKGEAEWAPVGGPVNDAAVIPSMLALKLINGSPYLAFQQNGVQVKHWDGTEWTADGPVFPSSLNASPALAGVDGVLYIGYAGSQTEVWFSGETGWKRKGSALNQAGRSASALSLAGFGHTIYAAWIENSAAADGGAVYVKTIAAQ